MTTRRSMLLVLCGLALFPLACSTQMRATRTVSYSSPYQTREVEVVTETEYRDFEDDDEHHVIEVEYTD